MQTWATICCNALPFTVFGVGIVFTRKSYVILLILFLSSQCCGMEHFELSARTMDKLAAIADIIVPGHDNYFLVDCVE